METTAQPPADETGEQQVLSSTAAAARRQTPISRLVNAIRGVATAVHSIYAITTARGPSRFVRPRSRRF
jgi:hypothetical protein